MATVSVSVLIRDEIEMLPLVMPCYASLQNTLQEVIFVDDGSTDGSRQKAHEIASEFQHMPIVWIEHEMKRWDEQRNIGLDAATGDFILTVDADMGFTGNLGWLLSQGYFDKADVWDFSIYCCRGNIYTYDILSTGEAMGGVKHNRTTRLVKNSGVRYFGAAHAQPEVYGGSCKTGIPISQAKRPKKAYCEEVWLFEWSCLADNDDALLERGHRLERFRAEMTARGIPPPSHDRYYNFKHSDAPTRRVPEHIENSIPTMERALELWGK
jgi:glycosyltransferase involved in cell wall biosynthesis